MRWIKAQTSVDETQFSESTNSTFFQLMQGRSTGKENLRLIKPDEQTSHIASDFKLPQIANGGNGVTGVWNASNSNHNNNNSVHTAISRQIQTDEVLNLGREMVEEAIRKVVREDGIKLVRQITPPYDNGNMSDFSGKRGKIPATHGKEQNVHNTSSGTEDDYPVMPDEATVMERISHVDHSRKPKKVTVDERVMHIERYNDEDVDDLEEDDEPSSLADFLQGTADRRFVHEKAIFQELTHLKRIQIQYGKVQERVLVRSLINNFCKMHGLNPAHFRYNTFYAWEKFLYDQLKLIYLEERDRIQVSASRVPRSSTQFERRLRKVSPLSDRIRELTRIYSTSANTLSRRTLSQKNRQAGRPTANSPGKSPLNRSSSQGRQRSNSGGRAHHCMHNGQSVDTVVVGGQKRCACLERTANEHNHILLNKD